MQKGFESLQLHCHGSSTLPPTARTYVPVKSRPYDKKVGCVIPFHLAKPLRADTPAGQEKNGREAGRLGVSGVAPQASLILAVGGCWGCALCARWSVRLAVGTADTGTAVAK